jgi:hypothetical protein
MSSCLYSVFFRSSESNTSATSNPPKEKKDLLSRFEKCERTIVPFGEYIGKSFVILLSDKGYRNWLIQQKIDYEYGFQEFTKDQELLDFIDRINKLFGNNNSYSTYESEDHRNAKETLKSWLEKNSFARQFSFKNFRVALEYPITKKGKGLLKAWPENSNFPKHSSVRFDIAIIQDEKLVCAFEVEKYNKVSKEKLEKIRNLLKSHNATLDLYEIKADWILAQETIPEFLEVEKLL